MKKTRETVLYLVRLCGMTFSEAISMNPEEADDWLDAALELERKISDA